MVNTHNFINSEFVIGRNMQFNHYLIKINIKSLKLIFAFWTIRMFETTRGYGLTKEWLVT